METSTFTCVPLIIITLKPCFSSLLLYLCLLFLLLFFYIYAYYSYFSFSLFMLIIPASLLIYLCPSTFILILCVSGKHNMLALQSCFTITCWSKICFNIIRWYKNIVQYLFKNHSVLYFNSLFFFHFLSPFFFLSLTFTPSSSNFIPSLCVPLSLSLSLSLSLILYLSLSLYIYQSLCPSLHRWIWFLLTFLSSITFSSFFGPHLIFSSISNSISY